MDVTDTATTAATRARALAAVLRTLPAAPAAATRRAIAAQLDKAARAFETEPVTFDGVAITNCAPGDAVMALWKADAEAEADRDAAHLRPILRHVLTPLGSARPELPKFTGRADTDTLHRAFAIRLRMVRTADALDRTADPDELRRHFTLLADLHRRYADLNATAAHA